MKAVMVVDRAETDLEALEARAVEPRAELDDIAEKTAKLRVYIELAALYESGGTIHGTSRRQVVVQTETTVVSTLG